MTTQPRTSITLDEGSLLTLSDDDWGVESPPKRKVFGFHETILSFGEPGSLKVEIYKCNKSCLT